MKNTTENRSAFDRHLAALADLYEKTTGGPPLHPVRLYNHLAGLEARAHTLTEALCNGFESETEQNNVELCLERITEQVAETFGGNLPENFEINRDPRGYALKLMPPQNSRGLDTGEPASPFKLHTDWGNNQILAPDFTEGDE
tara:strand:- start:1920 stop:2348 length:429 start_codon:yes stop_codon:yes gene_type:complete